MCGSYILQTNRQKFNNSQINPTCLLCQRNNETLERYILDCPALNSVRLPILNHIGISYNILTGKVFEKLSSSSKHNVIIDCSFLIGQEKVNKSKIKLQDLSEIEFHTRKITHVLYINRYSFLNKNATSR